MATMGLSYASAELVERLVRETGQRANLVAIACNEILKHLDPRHRVISQAAVESALESAAIDDALEGWRDLGGTGAEDSRLDRILVYATLGRDGFTQGEAMQLVEEMALRVEPERVQRSLKRLELAYVLGRSGSAGEGGARRYTFQVPLFVQRIREQEPEVLLAKELSSGDATITP